LDFCAKSDQKIISNCQKTTNSRDYCTREDSIGLAVPRREYALANTLPVQL